MRLPLLQQSTRLRYATFFYLYVVQGLPAGFALTALTNYLTARGASPLAIGAFAGWVGLPWILQVVWGPLIDRYPHSRWGHRKHWVVGGQGAAALVSLLLLLVTDPVTQLPLLSGLFLLHSIFASIQDASVDALAISITPVEERGRVNAFMRGGFLMGISLGATLMAFLLPAYGFRFAAGVQAVLLLLFTGLTILIPIGKDYIQKEAGEKATASVGRLFRRLGAAMAGAASLRTFGLMAACYLGFSIFIRSTSFHFIRVVGWKDTELSVLQGGWGSLCMLVIVFSGGWVSDRVGADRLQNVVMWVLGLFIFFFCLTAPGWNSRPYATGGLLFWSLADPLFSVAAFPVLMALCRRGIEGSQFTAYMALINLCDVAGSFLSGWALERVEGPLVGMTAGGIVLAAALLHSRSRYLQRRRLAPVGEEVDRLTG